MTDLLPGLATALYLGVLTSISPCPLATNIAAISYISRDLGRTRRVFFTGLFYTIGRTLSYVALAVLLVASALSMPAVSHFLERYMNRALGPILIVAGMFLLGLLGSTLSGPAVPESAKRKLGSGGVWGAGALGLLFALSFCPVSAALYFGSLIPLAISHRSSVAIPAVYGLGTAVPVLVFAILIAAGARSVGGAFGRVAAIERWARRVTGAAFIVVGILYTLTYIFGIPALG